MSSNQHLQTSCTASFHCATNHCITRKTGSSLDVAYPSYQHDENKRWKLLSPVAEQHLNSALSVNKVTRTRWTPKFSAKPVLFPYLLCLLHFSSKMLTCGEARNCQCRKMKWTCASHFVGVGLHCLSRELYTISSEPPGGWLLIGDECSQDTESAVYGRLFACHWQKKIIIIIIKNTYKKKTLILYRN